MVNIAEWTAAELEAERDQWTFMVDQRSRDDLLSALETVQALGMDPLDLSSEDVSMGSAKHVLDQAFAQAKHERGIAIVKGLPREGLDEAAFGLLTWLIGLHQGVARPQGKASQYMSEVRDVGTDYRSTTGRGYSSNAELDFHTDSADVVMLSCFNTAKVGGMSITTSSAAAYAALGVERPDQARLLREPVHFSRQSEQAPHESPSYPHPIIDFRDGTLFSKWNWNRVTSAQKLSGVPQISTEHMDALKAFDQVVRRPELAHTMWLEPGDLQIINSHATLHSRTNFEDDDHPARRRLLFRLWLAPPDGDHLPESWRVLYGAVEPGTVRGGIIGQAYDDRRRAFERHQAATLGMRLP